MGNEIKNTEKKQLLTLEGRARFKVDLVENVESFSEEQILLKTALGGISVAGSGLRLEDLSVENGSVILTGRIDRMDFVEIKEKHSFIKGLFK